MTNVGKAPEAKPWFIQRAVRALFYVATGLVKIALVGYCCMRAYRLRMHAVRLYGYIIHEFDPWFNYRATEYLAEHGAHKFFHWYDYMSWYPIGRPVGTTIYPGMQFISVWIWRAMEMIPETSVKIPKKLWKRLPKALAEALPYRGRLLKFGPMSVNDVCVMVPAWFGALATLFAYLLASELSGSRSVGVCTAFIMAIIPAHMMRSSAGEFDNECVAVAAFCATLWLWSRCIRTHRSWPIAIPAGLAYFGAAASWGGFIFINNLIALHVAVIVALGKHNTGVYKSYTLFYIVGTLGAMQIPVIGYAPLRSLEQMPSVLVFLTLQVMQMCDLFRRRLPMKAFHFCLFRAAVFLVLGTMAAGVAYILMLRGVFTPLGARIRGLFLEAVKTGNPLVDSVAEHQPANEQAYDSYLGQARYLAALGLFFCWHQRSPSKLLAFLYAAVAYHYSLKMSRLMIVCGPIVSVLAGYPLGFLIDWCLEQVIGLICRAPALPPDSIVEQRTGGMGSIWRFCWCWFGAALVPDEVVDLWAAKERFAMQVPFIDRPLRLGVAAILCYVSYNVMKEPTEKWIAHCDMMGERMGNPKLMFETQLNNGEMVMVDDYLRGYEWVKANTPADSRVMAWWDYGYQITGIANRTSIADGNTWNHEHIATLGKILTSNEKKCHKAMRHLADYALVWAGGRGDDMAKSPHLARIGNSVFPSHCGDDDPLCHKFSVYQDGSPTPMMAESFLYKAVNHGMKEGVRLNPKLWREVHTTKYGLLRVYKVMNVSQESKAWCANPANRVCDAPGSWYCVGQYPPAIGKLIAMRRNFKQLEDFNKGASEKSAYTKLIEKETGRSSNENKRKRGKDKGEL